MKKTLIYIVFLAITNLNAQEQLTINTSKSEIKWSCDYSFYFNGHYGYVNFQEGYFIKTGDMITSGRFVIDLNTIMATDMEAEGNKNLTAHLKDPDFFDVKKYPKASLVITKVTYHDPTHFEAEANLTIKGIIKPIKFQATVNFEEKTMTTKFKIDRTRWGITYNSTIKDSAISDAIGFEVKISL